MEVDTSVNIENNEDNELFDQFKKSLYDTSIDVNNSISHVEMSDNYFIPSHSYNNNTNKKTYHPRDSHHIPKRLKTITSDVYPVLDLQEEEEEDEEDCFIDDEDFITQEIIYPPTNGEIIISQMITDSECSNHYFYCQDTDFVGFVDWITDPNFGEIDDNQFQYYRNKMNHITASVSNERIKFETSNYIIEIIPCDSTEFFQVPMKCLGCNHIRKSVYFVNIEGNILTMGENCGEIHFQYKCLMDFIKGLKMDMKAIKQEDVLKIECKIYLNLFLELKDIIDTLHSKYCK